MAAFIELARWWRQKQRQEPSILARLLPDTSGSRHPRAQLLRIAATSEGKAFLRRRIAELSEDISARGSAAAEVHAALGSLHHLCGDDLGSAERHLAEAVRLDVGDAPGRFRCQLERVRRQRAADERISRTELTSDLPRFDDVPRRDAAGLSVEEFERDFAAKGVPVVITGLFPAMFPAGKWGWARIREALGHVGVTPRRRVAGSPDWANLEDAGPVLVRDLLDRIEAPEDDSSGTPRESRYLFDFNLPGQAPALVAELHVPSVFAADMLQALPPGTRYRDAWPSLFVGPRGSRSGLHVDAWGSQFWMALAEGTKRWTIFEREDTPLLGPSYAVSIDATFAAEAALAAGDAGAAAHGSGPGAAHRAGAARGWRFDLQAGEVLFVPAGCAHCVDNLTETAAVSANFVTAANAARARAELALVGCEDPAVAGVASALARVTAEARATGGEGGTGEGLEGGGEGGGAAQAGRGACRPLEPFPARLVVPWAEFKEGGAVLARGVGSDGGADGGRAGGEDAGAERQNGSKSDGGEGEWPAPAGGGAKRAGGAGAGAGARSVQRQRV